MLIYISSSNINKKVANTIQSLEMEKSFKRLFKTFSIFQSNKYHKNNNEVLLKKIGIGLISHFLFSLRVLIKLKTTKTLSNYKNIIYTRSEMVSIFLYLAGYKNIVLELHDIRPKSISYLILKSIKYSDLILICINTNIKSELIKKGFNKERIFVLSDGHGNNTNSLKDGITKYKTIKSKKTKLKIGYFGKISKTKGSSILKKIIYKYNNSIDFIIYSINKNEFKNLPCKMRIVDHKKVFKEMKKMDILLYVANLDKKNKHSLYTSPLKIYEYLSTLRPILYMPAGDLKAELENTVAIPFINEIDFLNALNNLLNLKSPKRLFENTYKLSNNRTWDKRAKEIKEIISKNCNYKN